LFDAVGSALTVPEGQMDAVTALSGSGPAYFLLLVEALVDAGVGAGLSREVATELTVQTMAGAAAMLLDRMDQTGRPTANRRVRGPIPRRPNCGPPLLRLGEPPLLRCANSKKADFGLLLTRRFRPPKAL